jgi:hypothetical protein
MHYSKGGMIALTEKEFRKAVAYRSGELLESIIALQASARKELGLGMWWEYVTTVSIDYEEKEEKPVILREFIEYKLASSLAKWAHTKGSSYAKNVLDSFKKYLTESEYATFEKYCWRWIYYLPYLKMSKASTVELDRLYFTEGDFFSKEHGKLSHLPLDDKILVAKALMETKQMTPKSILPLFARKIRWEGYTREPNDVVAPTRISRYLHDSGVQDTFDLYLTFDINQAKANLNPESRKTIDNLLAEMREIAQSIRKG